MRSTSGQVVVSILGDKAIRDVKAKVYDVVFLNNTPFRGVAMFQTAIGLCAIGIPVAWFCVRYIQSQLYETKGMNLTVLAIATLTLTAAAAAAGFIPALRASSTNPSQALRTE